MLEQYYISNKCPSGCPIPAGEINFGELFVKDEYLALCIEYFPHYLLIIVFGFFFRELEHWFRPGSGAVNYYGVSSVIFGFLFLLFCMMIYTFTEYETCTIPRWCEEGENNTLISSNYYYEMTECPKYYSWLPGDYETILGFGSFTQCESSKYGCCKLETTRCADFAEDNLSYSSYLYSEENNIGQWRVFIPKINEEGTNCPTIEQIIYSVSSHSQQDYNHVFSLGFCVYFINMIFILICIPYCPKSCCRKRVSFTKLPEQTLRGST